MSTTKYIFELSITTNTFKKLKMKNSEAFKKVQNLIENGIVICDENNEEWLSDGDEMFIYIGRGNWNSWTIGEDGIKQIEMAIPNGYGSDTFLEVRYCKNEKCNNPVTADELDIYESADNEYSIRKK